MCESDYLKQFGERISSLRRARGLTQEQLADASGLHRTHIGMIERAEKNISLSSIYKLAKGLGVDIKVLFE